MAKQLPVKGKNGWTIYDIADLAKVSAKTVSRVVSGEPGVGPQTRARIEKIIAEVGYQPHTGAKSMRGRTKDTVGVTLTAPIEHAPVSQAFFLWLFPELYRVFGARGNFLSFDLNPCAHGGCTDYARGLWQQRFAACVILGPLHTDDPVLQRVHESGYPYLATNRIDSLPEGAYAAVDYAEASYVGTRHLIERGHQRIAQLATFEGYQNGTDRQNGYRRALNEFGIEPDPAIMRYVTFGASHVADVVYRLLVDRSVTALVDCSGLEDAQSIYEGARKAGRTPGKDFEIVTWTYSANAMVLAEASAHVWLPVREALAEGLELLANWVNGERDEPFQILYPPTLYDTQEFSNVAVKPNPLFTAY